MRRGERMQARSHRLVRVLEHPELGLAAAAQDRRVGSVVDLDRVDQRGHPRRPAASRVRPERGACVGRPASQLVQRHPHPLSPLPCGGHAGLAILPRLWDESP